jgi:hypothetical protein
MFLAVIQLVSKACRPYSPNATKLLREAIPFILPRWLLRYLTLFGIIAIFSDLHKIYTQEKQFPANKNS